MTLTIVKAAWRAALHWRCIRGALNGSKWRSMTLNCSASSKLGPTFQAAFGRQFRHSQACKRADPDQTKAGRNRAAWCRPNGLPGHALLSAPGRAVSVLLV